MTDTPLKGVLHKASTSRRTTGVGTTDGSAHSRESPAIPTSYKSGWIILSTPANTVIDSVAAPRNSAPAAVRSAAETHMEYSRVYHMTVNFNCLKQVPSIRRVPVQTRRVPCSQCLASEYIRNSVDRVYKRTSRHLLPIAFLAADSIYPTHSTKYSETVSGSC